MVRKEIEEVDHSSYRYPSFKHRAAPALATHHPNPPSPNSQQFALAEDWLGSEALGGSEGF